MRDQNSILIRNTLFLYGRMLITMWLNLYATRLVLQNLGVEDMGVYGVVYSTVNLFNIVTAAVTVAIQRFVSCELGLGEKGDVNKVFCTSVNITLVLSAIILLLLEVGGTIALHYFINIPEASRDAAGWVLHFCVITCILQCISIPYNALIIAYEKINFFALISVICVALTCIASYSLSWFDHRYRLPGYAFMLTCIAAINPVSYALYCYRELPYSKYHFSIDRETVRQMSKFASITSISALFLVLSNQGIAIVINLVFGVALNGVYTIAWQLRNMVMSFAYNVFRALQPQILKTYTENNIERHRKLVYGGSKAGVFLTLFILVPFMWRADLILQFWLHDVPEYTVTFCRCTIFVSLTYAAFQPIRTAVLATNNITRFMLIPDSLTLIVLPLGYIIGNLTGKPEMMILCIISVDIFCCILRIWLGTKVSVLTISDIFRKIIFRSTMVAALSLCVCYLLSRITENNITGLLLMLILNSLALCVIIYAVGISKEERQMTKRIFNER